MIYLWAIIFLLTMFIIMLSVWNSNRRPTKRAGVAEWFAMGYFYIILLYLVLTVDYIR